MRKLQLVRNISLLALSVIGAFVISGCATSPYVRTYYQDCNGRYTVDSCCQKDYLYRGKYTADKGPYCYKDCKGRCYSKDSYGNVFYRH